MKQFTTLDEAYDSLKSRGLLRHVEDAEDVAIVVAPVKVKKVKLPTKAEKIAKKVSKGTLEVMQRDGLFDI